MRPPSVWFRLQNDEVHVRCDSQCRLLKAIRSPFGSPRRRVERGLWQGCATIDENRTSSDNVSANKAIDNIEDANILSSTKKTRRGEGH